MKKILLLAALTGAVLLAACSNADNKIASAETPAPSPAAAFTEPPVMQPSPDEEPAGYIPSDEDMQAALAVAGEEIAALEASGEGHVEITEPTFDPKDPARGMYGLFENTIVFRVDIDIKEDIGGWEKGKDTGWMIIVTREDKDAEWKLSNSGH